MVKTYIQALIILVLISACATSAKKNTSSVEVKTKNTFVLSFCSVSRKFLPIYSNNSTYSNIGRVFSQSLVFMNAYSNVSWSNLKRYFARESWKEKYRKYDQKNELPLQVWDSDIIHHTFLRVPAVENVEDDISDYYDDVRLTSVDNEFTEIANLMKQAASGSSNISIVHFKLMHYPYLTDQLYALMLKSQVLEKSEIDLIENYKKNFASYPDKKIFFQVLFGFKEFTNYFIKNGTRIDYTNDHDEFVNWSKSKGQNVDFALLEKVYRFRLGVLDKLVGKIYDLYKSNYENSMNFVITGDHGEAFMEHDNLTHAGIPYDEVTSFFYSAHLSGQTKMQLVHSQVSQKEQESQLSFLTSVSSVYSDFDNFLISNEERSSKIYSFNCAGNIAAIRQANGWKGIYNLISDEFQLFNLNNDPNEKVDISSINKTIKMQMQTNIKFKLDRLKFNNGTCISAYNF